MKPITDEPPELRVIRGGGRRLTPNEAMEAGREEQLLPPRAVTAPRGIYILPYDFYEGKQTVAAITSKGIIGAFYHVTTVGEYDDAYRAASEFLRTCDPEAGVVPLAAVR